MTKIAFLGKSRKDYLRMLTIELGLTPSNNLKIIELKDLITKSDRYDEEFGTATENRKAAELKKQSCGCGSATRKRIRTLKNENST
ncbi:uncharacterized protein TNCV_1689021 [Trichonephila clavipes]|nr:uncharacterized protein TNCV_1689021 [Trichonephila clavipes]